MSSGDVASEAGLAIIPGALASAEIASVFHGLGRITLPRSRAGTRNALQVDTVAALARSSRLFGIAREILGRDAIPYRATLFEKSPHANWLVAWHQDRAIPLRERRERAGDPGRSKKVSFTRRPRGRAESGARLADSP
jgi:hypothetical protein